MRRLYTVLNLTDHRPDDMLKYTPVRLADLAVIGRRFKLRSLQIGSAVTCTCDKTIPIVTKMFYGNDISAAAETRRRNEYRKSIRKPIIYGPRRDHAK